MKEILAGFYWMVADRNGDRAICQGEKPKKTENLGWWTVKIQLWDGLL